MTRGVLILTPYFYPVIGGVESNAERLARYLAGEGVRVQVLTKRLDRTLPDGEVRDGVTIRRIGPRGERSASGKWRVTPAAFVWLVRHASAYDVVCCVDYRATGLAALLARAVTGRPVVVQAQTTGVLSGDNADPMLRALGIDPASVMARWLKKPIRAIYGRADAVAGISREIEREARESGVPPERTHYFPNAVDMSRFRPAGPGERDQLRRQLNLPVDAVICLFVGRLSKEKGLGELLEAWRVMTVRLKADPTTPSLKSHATAPGLKADPTTPGLKADPATPGLKSHATTSGPKAAPTLSTWGPPSGGPLLVIAGPDMTGHSWDAGASGRAFVDRHRLGDSVRFLGAVADVAPLVRAVDLVVQPSHFEALGLSAIEALASAVPVAASAVGGLLEFMVDGVNGRLFPPRDPPALAACLQALVSDAGERARLASRARASVVDDYDERVVFGRMRELFERLAAEARKTRS